jgi:hypothetical protein
MDAYDLVHPLIFIVCLSSAFITALVPLVAAGPICSFFDGDLLNERYWNFESQSQVFFFAYRRAMAYLAAMGWNRLCQYRFPGYPRKIRLSIGKRLLCSLYLSFYFLSLVAILGSFIKVILFGRYHP